MTIKCGNCKQYHGSTAEVKACYGIASSVPDATITKVAAAAVPAPVPATDKQVAFINKLTGERFPDFLPEVLAEMAKAAKAMTKAQASKRIEALLAMPKPEKAKATTATTGYAAEAKKGDVHFVNGTYYRIHVGQKSGKPYVCKAYIVGEAKWNADGSLDKPAKVEWDIAKGFMSNLSVATKATAEQAHAFAMLSGRCCFCSHAIDTPESTAVGYGPVCAGKYGLPWGDTSQTVPAVGKAMVDA